MKTITLELGRVVVTCCYCSHPVGHVSSVESAVSCYWRPSNAAQTFYMQTLFAASGAPWSWPERRLPCVWRLFTPQVGSHSLVHAWNMYISKNNVRPPS